MYYKDKGGTVWAHAHTYLSADGKHDNQFVQHVNAHLIGEVKVLMEEQGDKMRVDEVKGKLVVGQIVALFTGGGEFALAKIVQLPRKAKVGEMVVGHRAVHGNSWVVEVDWSSGVAGSTAQGSRKFKFEVGDMCGKTECMCGSALNCTKRHSHLAYVDSVLPPLELGMVKEGSSSRRLRKRQKQQQQAANKPEFWVLPPGSKQKLMRTMAADIEAGVTYTRYT